MTTKQRPMIQSVERAANILKTLAAGPGLLGVSELSARLGLAKATIHGLLRTLEAHGLVEQDAASDKYRLGAALLRLGNSYLDSSDLRARSLVWSERLSARTAQAVRVGVPHGAGVLVIHHVFRPDNTLQILEVGAVLPAHASALGKAIVAFDADLERRLLGEPLARLTGRTHTSPAALRRDLSAIRGRGYAVEREEAVIGDGGIAAPIFDRTGAPVGAIGIAGPVGPLARRGAEAGFAAAAIEAARAISRELGASGWPPPPA